jgi:BASS family bile acid:Na+ symporter
VKTLIVVGIKASIALLVFGLGLRANRRVLEYLRLRPRLLVRSLLAQLVVMPIVAAMFLRWLDLRPEVKLALITLAVSPIPPRLPHRQIKASGATDYALSLLVLVALVSIVSVPAAVALLGLVFERAVNVPARIVAAIVFSTIVAPLGAGIAVRYAAPRLTDRLEAPLTRFANLVLLVCCVPLVVVVWPALGSLLRIGPLVAIASYCVLALAVGHVLGGPEAPNRVVLALSTASRHPAVAIAIANITFPNLKSAPAAVLLVLVVAAILSAVYLAAMRPRRPQRREKRSRAQVTKAPGADRGTLEANRRSQSPW